MYKLSKVKRNKDFLKHPFVRFAAITTAALLLFLIVKKDGIVTWIKTGFSIAEQKRHIESLERRNAELDEKIRALREDRDTLEKYARETYLFAAPGEDIYIIEE